METMANIIKTKMKITVTKVLRELEKNNKWEGIDKDQEWLIRETIKETLKVVDEILRTHKNITILK